RSPNSNWQVCVQSLLVLEAGIEVPMKESIQRAFAYLLGQKVFLSGGAAAWTVLKEVPHEMVQRPSVCDTSTLMSGGAAAWTVSRKCRTRWPAPDRLARRAGTATSSRSTALRREIRTIRAQATGGISLPLLQQQGTSNDAPSHQYGRLGYVRRASSLL